MQQIIMVVLSMLLLLPAPLIICINYRSQQPAFRALAFLLFFSILIDGITTALYVSFGTNPNLTSLPYVLFAPGLISLVFYFLIGSRSLKTPLVAFNFLYIVFVALNFIFIQGNRVHSYPKTLEALLAIILSILFFWRLLQRLPTAQLHRLPAFWIASAFFFSYSGKLVIYAATNYLTQHLKDNLLVVWHFHNLLSIIANIVFVYAAWLNHKQLKSTLSSRLAS